MPTKRLTQLTIDRLRPPKARVTVSDSTLPGFQLRYGPSSRDPNMVDGSYSIRYWSPVTGKRTRYTIGSIHKLSLVAARKFAREQFEAIGAGRDPQLDKKRKRADEDPAPGTVDALIAEFDKRYLQAKWKNPHKARRTLERELIERKPSWSGWPIGEVSKADMHAKLDRLVDEGKGYAANRLLEVVRLMFSYAVGREYIATSPAQGIRRPLDEKPRDRVLDDPNVKAGDRSELKALWTAFEGLGYPFGPYFQILLLTGQRAGEVAGMTWDEVDLDVALWWIPAHRTKSDRPHKVPLSPWAVEILEAVPRFEDNPHVFCGRESSGKPISGFSRAGERARLAAGVDNWRPHDLRRTVRTHLPPLGTPPHVAELVLNHAVKGQEGVYDWYDYTSEKREALNRWSEHLGGIVSAGESNVVALR